MLTPSDTLLSLDPSSTAYGYAVFRGGSLATFGVAGTNSRMSSAERIDFLAARLRKLVAEVAPSRVVMEWTGGKVHGRMRGRHVSGLAVLGQAQGVLYATLTGLVPHVDRVGEGEWTGGVPKPERARRIALEFPEYRKFRDAGRDPGGDASDSIGLGLFYLARQRIETLASEGRTP